MEGIPAKVEGGIGHGIVTGEGVFLAVDDGWDADFAIFGDDGAHPLVTDGESSALECVVHIGAPPEPFFLYFKRIEDHALAVILGRPVETADEIDEIEVGLDEWEDPF